MEEAQTQMSMTSFVPMENISTNAPVHYWEDDMSRLLYAVPSTIFMVIGTIGNILSFLVYSRKSMSQSVMSVYFRVLAVSDTVVLFSGGVIFFAIGVLERDIQVVSEASCKFWIPLLKLSCYHSCWILVFISIDRFIGVHFPHKYRQLCTKGRALTMMAAWFVIVVIIVFAYFATIFTLQSKEAGVYVCDIGKPYVKFFLGVYQWFDLAVLNLIPSMILVTVNITIIVKIIRSASDSMKSTKSSNIKSPTVILISVSVVYLLCTIPTSTAFIVTASFHGPRKQAMSTLYIRTCHTLYLANHAVNFFLYCLHGSTFRKELGAMFGCKSKRSLSTYSSSHGPSTELSVYRKRSDLDKPQY